MKSPTHLHLIRGSARTYLLAVIAISAIVAASALVLRAGTETAPVAADDLQAPVSAPAAAGYIKLGDIKGESTDDSHKDWINLVSVSHGISRPLSSGISGSTRQRASATFGDIVVVKELDKSSTKLQEAIATGEVFPLLELDLVAPGSGVRAGEPYLRWELKNVRVTNYRINGSVSGSDRPTETIALNFEEIKVTYTEQAADGSKKGNVEYTWKIEEGTQ